MPAHSAAERRSESSTSARDDHLASGRHGVASGDGRFGGRSDPRLRPSLWAVEPLLLTVEEAAHALRVGRSTVYQLLSTGELESVRIGSSRRVPVLAVQTYIDSLKVPETGPPPE